MNRSSYGSPDYYVPKGDIMTTVTVIVGDGYVQDVYSTDPDIELIVIDTDLSSIDLDHVNKAALDLVQNDLGNGLITRVY